MNILKILPGFLLTLSIATIATVLQNLPFVPFSIQAADGHMIHPIENMVLAIIIGIIIGNVLFSHKTSQQKSIQNCMGVGASNRLKEQLKTGVNFTVKYLLPLGIILMGVRLNFTDVIKASAHGLLLNIICVLGVFFLVVWICSLAKINRQLSFLIAIGTAICGSTAIVAAAPVIRARQSDTAIAITTISVFGLIAIFVYPIIGHVLGLNQTEFGLWSGTAIQAIPQVVAAAFSYGTHAGDIGTITKLVRVLLLAPFMVGLSLWYAKQPQDIDNMQVTQKLKWYRYCPRFILIFLVVVMLNNFGLFHSFTLGHVIIHTVPWLSQVSLFLMTMAMAGIGLHTDLKVLFSAGVRPMFIGCMAAVLLGIVSLGMIYWL